VSVADQVTRLHSVSGLTWEEMGKIMGVGRRAVHGWANGTRVSASNQARLNRLDAEVTALVPLPPEHVRVALYDSSRGESIMNRLYREATAGRQSLGDIGLPPRVLLGLGDADVWPLPRIPCSHD
jgi:hypothetical protein